MQNVLRRVAFGVLGTGMIVTMAAGATTAASAAVAAPHATPAKSVTLSWPAVRKTAQGNRVLTIQYLLNDRGYKVSTTGYFGDETEKQVIAFQKARKLTADGIVGDDTWPELVVKDLGPGTKHADAVKAVQSYLKNAYGYTTLKVNGTYDKATETAVKSFQKDYKLPVTGKVDLDTWHMLVVKKL